MKAERLLRLFDRVADAPDAVARLRRLVLALAVRGKLAEQCATDTPSEELIIAIQTERVRRNKEGQLVSIRSYEKPRFEMFPIPKAWRWAKLGFIVNILMGQSPPGSSYNRTGEGVPLINGPVEFSADAFGITTINQYTTAPTKICKKDDLLLCVRGSTTGRTNIAGFDSCIGRGVAALQSLYADQFIRIFICSLREKIIDMGRGIAFPSISRQQLEELPVPLPPLSEQHRIIQRFDELMTLCDQLEAAQAKREQRRDQLSAAMLDQLVKAEPGEEGRKAARFYLNRLPRLMQKIEHVQALRQTILDLAVRGRLVRQNPAEIPASDLLEKINQFKTASIKGRTANESSLRSISKAQDFLLPQGWLNTTVGEITVCRDGERIPLSREERAKRPGIYDYYGASAVTDKVDEYLFDKPLLLVGEDGANLINRSTPIAFIARGKYWVNNHAHVLDGISEDFLRFLELYFNAIDLTPFITGTAQPKMNQAKMNSIPIALPPEKEQIRIVAKANQLMSLCDQLNIAIQTQQQTTSRLLGALIAEALADSPDSQAVKAKTQWH